MFFQCLLASEKLSLDLEWLLGPRSLSIALAIYLSVCIVKWGYLKHMLFLKLGLRDNTNDSHLHRDHSLLFAKFLFVKKKKIHKRALKGKELYNSK